MRGIILANGDITNYRKLEKYFKGEYMLVCVDGGLRHAKKFNIKPDVILGDLDSCKNDLLKEYEDVEKIVFSKDKDYTDGDLAIQYLVSKKVDEIYFFGGTGSRLDHTLCNIYMIIKAIQANIPTYIVDEKNKCTLVLDHLVVDKEDYENISLIPISLTDGVEIEYTKGLKYELKEEELFFSHSRGISNKFLKDNAQIKIKKGILLVILSND